MDLRPSREAIYVLSLVALLVGASKTAAPGATNDNNVEWNGVFSHSGSRDPEFPGKAEDFSVELRVFRGDITAASVRTWDGTEARYPMAWVRNEGPFDIWKGTIAGSSSDFLYYRFEVTDGADTDYYNVLGMWTDAPSHGDFLVNLTALGRFPLGATPDGAGAVFRVWAPNAASAAVAGSFNNWSADSHPMESVRGYWQLRVPVVDHGAQYKFVFTNDARGGDRIWRTDPRARAQTNSVGNSVVWRSTHVWNDTGWVAPSIDDLVIYELHVGSFSGEGDGSANSPGRLRDVVDRHLDHLVDLGVNAVELMPVGEFAGERSWGYNPAFLFAPESAYGTPSDMKYLVDRCHRAGIAVLLDVVFNHMGASDLAGNLLDYDGEEIYFYPEGSPYRETPWGPRLDYGRRQVRELIRDNIRYWLEEFHIDGFRLDGTDFIKVNADGWEVLRDIARVADTVSVRAVVIAEQLPNDPAVSRPVTDGGGGSDGQWNDLFHDSLRSAIREAAFGDPSVSAVADGMNHFGIPGYAVNYIESHDEARRSEACDVGRVARVADCSDPHSEWSYGRSKLAYGLVMFSAGIPMLLQGQEFMEDRGFGDAETDRIQWTYRRRYEDFYLAARDMTWLRRVQPALRAGSHQNIYHVNDGANVIAWHRWTDFGDDLVIVASFANDDFAGYCVGMPQSGEWLEVFSSDAALYGGRNVGNGGLIVADGGGMHGLPYSACVALPRMGVLVFARESTGVDRPSFLRGDCNGDGEDDLSDAVRVLLELFLAVPPGECQAACDANGDAAVDLSDPIFLLDFIFRGGPAIPLPFPDCQEAVTVLPCDRECS